MEFGPDRRVGAAAFLSCSTLLGADGLLIFTTFADARPSLWWAINGLIVSVAVGTGVWFLICRKDPGVLVGAILGILFALACVTALIMVWASGLPYS